MADAPDWLLPTIRGYWKDPDRFARSLCASVAAELLGDGARGDEVVDEVREALKGKESA